MAETYTTSAGYGNFSWLKRARELMANLFILGSGASNEDEVALELPTRAEATDLAQHTERCALRYRSLKNGLRTQGDRLKRIEVFIFATGLVLILTDPPIRDTLKWLFGAL